MSSRHLRVYLDNNATTPILDKALDVMCDAAKRTWGNPSGQYMEGREAAKALETARATFAKIMNVDPSTIYFTSCGTESNNIVIRSIISACAASRNGRDTVVTSSVEHSSIVRTADLCGAKHIMVPVDRHGYLEEKAFRDILRSNARKIGLISIIMAQNEIGTMQHITALVRIAREVLGPNIPFHTDATQTLGKYYIEPDRLGVDLLTGSSHKFRGPRGVGILYAKKGILDPSMTPMTGGGQERGCRGGTENVPAILGAAAAFKYALGDANRWQRHVAKIKTLRDTMLASFVRNVPGLVINGDPQRGLYNTLSVAFPNGHAHAMCSYLDQHGIAVGSGSACSKGKPSLVLMAVYGGDASAAKIAHGTIRVSLSDANTAEECETATNEIIRAWRITSEMVKD